MRILIILICLLPISLSNPIVNASKDYRNYHEQINKAETCISNEHFQEALNTYQEVFNTFDFVFIRDYKIAAQLALHVRDSKTAFEMIEKGISGGWNLKSIKKNKYLSKLQTKPEWNYMEEVYLELRKQYVNRINRDVREEVQQMFKRDQKKAFGAWHRIRDKAQKRYAVKIFAPHSERQLTRLIEMLENHSYPGEQLIGNNFWMSTIVSHHNSITQAYTSKDTLYLSIRPKLIKSIQTGHISPYEFALIDDWYIATSSASTQVGYGFVNSPSNSTLSETNKLRQKIGLRNVELRNKLVNIERETGMNFYLPNWIDGEIKVEEK